ncbi:MAG: phosphonate C-P lyase system protein PhnL [Desulfobacterales bacterium]
MSPDTLLQVEDLAKRFVCHMQGGKEILGFEGVSFRVRQGTALALTGPSGAGKSSVLKCIYRSYLPVRGRIRYRPAEGGEIDLARASETEVLRIRRGEIGYVTQFLSVVPRVPAVDVVAEPLATGGVSLAEARRSARALLERLGIERTLWEAYPVTFSGGEKQRVNFARAVIRPPRLLLLDEPTASLDRRAMTVVIELLAEMKSRGTTMIAVFHENSPLDALMDERYRLPAKESPS